MSASASIETRVTDWRECSGGPWCPNLQHGGYTHYRIRQECDGLRWFQRHEWRCADGSTETDRWIIGVRGWVPGAMDPAAVEAAE